MATNIDFEKELNPVQWEAVRYCQGPSLVVAGAGSGKTRVLTYKVAYLLSLGLPPESILAITFTNKAAREMKERLYKMADGSQVKHLAMGTFHSVFSRILRSEAPLLNLSADYTVYDTSDVKSLITKIIKEKGLDVKTYSPKVVMSRISKAKNQLITASQYRSGEWTKQDLLHRLSRIVEVYDEYEKRCRQANAIDFDDMLLLSNMLFHQHPEVLDKYRQIFKYILVDEYQDTNYAQYMLVKQLAIQHRCVCVVGDDAQSIYGFRGANINNILQFTQTYPEARVFKLEENYRSSQNIVKAASALIKKNERQIPKEVFSSREEGERVEVRQMYSDTEEAMWIAQCVKQLHRQSGVEWKENAVLYRTNAQSRNMEEAFRKCSIPYVIYGGQSFYQRKEVKDVLAYLRLMSNITDEEAFVRIVNYPSRKLGQATIDKVVATARLQQVSPFEVAEQPMRWQLDVNAAKAALLIQFTNLIKSFMEASLVMDAYELVKKVINDSGIRCELLQDHTPEGVSAMENIDELLNGVHQYCEEHFESEGVQASISQFLQEVALLTDQDTQHKDDENNRVRLMTIHAAKGLEFNQVFVAGLEENLFPSAMSLMSASDLEEERRLLYVAITRARNRCWLTCAKSRFRNGTTEYPNPSRFLKDIDAGLLNNYITGGIHEVLSLPDASRLKRISKSEHTSMPPTTDIRLRVGSIIEHGRFGQGVVQQVENSPEGIRITVSFDSMGVKTLLLKFAKITIITY